MRRDRALAHALWLGALSGSLVYVASAAMGLSVRWPGAIAAFVQTACTFYLFATRRGAK